MPLKSDIKKAITNNTKYNALRVYKPVIEGSGTISNDKVMIIEVLIRDKNK